MRQKVVIAILCAALLALGVRVLHAGYLDPGLESTLRDLPREERQRVIVHMAERADLGEATRGIVGRNKSERSRRVIEALQATAQQTQRDILNYLERHQTAAEVENIISYWVFNGLAVTATKEIIYEIAARADVDWVSEDRSIPPPELLPGKEIPTKESVEWNIAKIRAPEIWDLGYDGTGVVVGSFDTGVDVTHVDLQSRYRGGSNSWFDPYYGTSTPYDYDGHGTHTTGTILGGNASGKYIGVAPGAKWIAAKGWRDDGTSSVTAFHDIFEWFMDPDGNPGTYDAPDVVNNSWTIQASGCPNDFLDDCRAWVAAGIFPAFSSGNKRTGLPFKVRSPGNYSWNEDEELAFGMGATDSADDIWEGSCPGPSPCNDEICPEACAPGVNVNSSLPGDNWDTKTGTSMACAHLTGSVALLLDINSELTVQELGDALQHAAVDLGIPGEDNYYGSGRLALIYELCGVVHDGWQGPLIPGVPYLITCDIRIPVYQTLTIDPGALILFESEFYKITAEGTLVTNGELDAPVELITRDTPHRGMKLMGDFQIQDGGEFRIGGFVPKQVSTE